MHVLDIWVEQFTLFYPANLKKFVVGIAKQLVMTFKFLFVDWWWLSLFFLFSQAFFVLATLGVASLTTSQEVLRSLRIIVFAPQVYFAFLAALYNYPSGSFRSPTYIKNHQPLFWPIVTPFVLLVYFSGHIFKFFALLTSFGFTYQAVEYLSYAFMTKVDLFASPLFVFYAFAIIATYVEYGVWYALEYAFTVFWHTYPLCILMFGCLYGVELVFEYGLEYLALINPWLILLVNLNVILIPVGIILFGAVYKWYVELIHELD